MKIEMKKFDKKFYDKEFLTLLKDALQSSVYIDNNGVEHKLSDEWDKELLNIAIDISIENENYEICEIIKRLKDI